MIRLAPVFVTDVRGPRVLLAPEVEEFLPELRPPFKPLCHLQRALVERYLQRRDEILLRDGVFTRGGAVHLLAKAGDGHRDVVKASLLQEVGDGHPDARLIHDEFGDRLAYGEAVEDIVGEWGADQEGS